MLQKGLFQAMRAAGQSAQEGTWLETPLTTGLLETRAGVRILLVAQTLMKQWLCALTTEGEFGKISNSMGEL